MSTQERPTSRNPTPLLLDDRRRANLGSGRRYDPSAVNVDVTAETGPDIVHNLNDLPWPFPDDRFDELHLRDVLEHLNDTVRVMEEIHRVLRPGGKVHIVVPHFSSNGAYADPTHKQFFSLGTFDYFTAGHPNNFYTRARFRRETGQIVFRPSLLNKIVWRLANRFPIRYEERWAWIFPAWFVSVVLGAEKTPAGKGE